MSSKYFLGKCEYNVKANWYISNTSEMYNLFINIYKLFI